MQSPRRILVVCLMALVLAPACGGDKKDPYLGNMNDFTYGGRIGKQYGPSASGSTVRLEDFKGRYVWIDFAAPWCPPCRAQAKIMRNLEKSYPGKVVFLTLMTSDEGVSSRATQRTAQSWARQFGLDPKHVMPTTEWGRKIPQHVLFSPLGQVLEWRIGLMQEAQIKGTLAKQMREWNHWYAENKDSPSVILSDIGDLGN